MGDSIRSDRFGSALFASPRGRQVISDYSLHQPSFCFELVHCNEIVGPLVQCEKPTPETSCPRGKLGENPRQNPLFRTAHAGIRTGNLFLITL